MKKKAKARKSMSNEAIARKMDRLNDRTKEVVGTKGDDVLREVASVRIDMDANFKRMDGQFRELLSSQAGVQRQTNFMRNEVKTLCKVEQPTPHIPVAPPKPWHVRAVDSMAISVGKLSKAWHGNKPTKGEFVKYNGDRWICMGNVPQFNNKWMLVRVHDGVFDHDYPFTNEIKRIKCGS